MRIISIILLFSLNTHAFTEFYVFEKDHYIQEVNSPCDEKANKIVKKHYKKHDNAFISGVGTGAIAGGIMAAHLIVEFGAGAILLIPFGALPVGAIAFGVGYYIYLGITADFKKRYDVAEMIVSKEYQINFKTLVENSHESFFQRDLKKAKKKYANYINQRARQRQPIELTFEEYLELNPLPEYTYKDRAQSDIDEIAKHLGMKLIEEHEYESFRIHIEGLMNTQTFCPENKRKIIGRKDFLKIINETYYK
jgi:hypothetical protein